MSVSFDLELGAAIRESASSTGATVSSWLAVAARDRLRLEALGEAVTSWEQRYGPLSGAEMVEADHILERAAAPGRAERDDEATDHRTHHSGAA